MCDFGAFLSAGGALFKGAAGANAGDQNAELAQGNHDLLVDQAKIAKGNADLAVTRGNYDEFLTRRKVAGVLDSTTAHYAGGNIDPTYGSPLLMQGFSAAQGETDAQIVRAHMMTERADALTTSANIYGQAATQQFKSAAAKADAITSMVSGVIGAGTSLLSSKSLFGSPSGGPGGGDGVLPGGLPLGQGGIGSM